MRTRDIVAYSVSTVRCAMMCGSKKRVARRAAPELEVLLIAGWERLRLQSGMIYIRVQE